MSTEKATESSGFLDGRDYTAAFIYEFCALLVGNGVYAGELAPTATNENMTITHGSGHAWINGVCYRNTTPFVLDIATADGALNRYDSLMLRLDLSANETYAIIVQGEYATAPTPPACTRNAEIHDLKICDIYVPAGCTKITQDLITDTRMDASVCGVPVFPVDHLDMTTFYKQVAADLANFRAREQADFSAWVTGQEESHIATMHDLVELVRITSENSRAEILELLRQLNELLDGDTVGELIAAIDEKLPRSGGDLTGDLQMGGHKVTSLAEPTESTDAATKNYADKMLPLDGSKPMTGAIAMGGNRITDLGTPTANTDAASVDWVIKNVWAQIYKVGAIYISADSTSPASLFGGTWVMITNRFLLAAGDLYEGGTTGGEAEHTLNTDEIPSHMHGTKKDSGGSVGFWKSTATSGSGWAVLSGGDKASGAENDLVTKATGGGKAHNNMPPYLAVYMWERVA